MFVAIAVLLTAAVFVSSRWHVPYYSITPGSAESVAPNVSISGLGTDAHHDRIMLTDVYLNPLTALSWLTTQLDSHAQIIPANYILPTGISSQQLDEQAYLDMSTSKDNARVAALRALGWKIPATSDGALVYAVFAGEPAARAHLQVADRIVAVNNTPVTSACDLINATHNDPVGTVLHFRIVPASISPSGTITYGAARTKSVTTVKPKSDEPASQCSSVTAVSRSVVGLELSDAIHYHLPGHISIATPSIGGPSAGLAMTLAVIDRLSAGSLTGKLTIAATGTMDPLGNVGDVGGVAQKTVAVQNAGATVFIVPQVEVKTARDASNGHLRVIGVTTLRQVLTVLLRLGGAATVPLTKPYFLKPTT